MSVHSPDSSDSPDIEVNVVSSPESSPNPSRASTPIPNCRMVNHISSGANVVQGSQIPSGITCYPIIKTNSVVSNNNDCDDKMPEQLSPKSGKNNNLHSPKSASSTTSTGYTSFSISSILSRQEPSAKRTNGQSRVLEAAAAAAASLSPCTDNSSMLSR